MAVLRLQPITFAEARDFIERYHRHHQPPLSWKFGVAVRDGDRIVGVAVAGRPVSRFLDDGWTVEITRLCTDGTHNAASMLLSAIWRAARALGYTRAITYTLQTESGASLRAASWKLVGAAGGGTWNRPNRRRVDKHPTGRKLLWEAPGSTRMSEPLARVEPSRETALPLFELEAAGGK